jgi:diguanylate cyclase (GGDEF)-like protein
VRSRAVLLVIVASLPFALLIFRSAEEQRHQYRQAVSQHAEHLARLVAAKHAEMLAYANEALLLAAADLDDPAFAADCVSRLRRIAGVSPVHSISLADAAGRILCSSVPAAAGVEVGDRDYFRRAHSSRGFSSSGVTLGRISKINVVLAAYPVMDSAGAVDRVLVAEILLNWVPRALAEAGAPDGFSASILTASGEVLRRFDDAPTAAADGYGTISAQVRLPSPEHESAFVRIGLPAALAERPADMALRRGLTVLAVTFALALLIALAGANFFVARPLRKLADATARLDSGDLGARTGVAHRGHEIGKLALLIDTLAAHREKVTRALRALSAGNRTLLREQEEPQLLQAMCNVAVQKGGYPLAVVYYAADDDEKSVLAAAHAGDDRGALEALNLTWADNERGQGTVATAIRTGSTKVFQSIAGELGALPHRDALMSRGFGSVASMPLRVQDRTIGTFTLFADEPNAFDKEELELVQEMADDLAFGIAAVRERVRRIDAEREARRVATHDGLTDLHNRSYFLNMLEQAIATAAAQRGPLAVLAVHVRDYAALTDALGYAPATQAIREIADRLRRIVPESASLARVPPDDFVVLAAGLDAERARAQAGDLLAAFAKPVSVGATQVDVQGHVGASFYPGHGDEPDLLLRRAAIAAREGAKRDHAYTAYAGATEREDPARIALIGDLRRAIDTRGLELHFQPKVELRDGRTTVGAEALVRWRHPARGAISPGQFVPLAEQTGLIRNMTYLVMELAIRQLRSWLEVGLRLPVAINLSVRNFYDPRLVERVEGMLATWGVPSELLEFEITEGALVEEPRTAREVLERLRKAAGKIYIDDFGTGYSSLSYLVSLPVHALKIDRSFIVQMTKSKQAHAVVASIISMGHQLGLRVVAEGVERAEERDTLIALGCDQAQGYLFSPPVPNQSLESFLKR